MNKDEKLKALDAAIARIEKDYGKGSIMRLGDQQANMDVETVPTGSLSLDLALGLGGIPRGRIIEIYGPESSGKTTVTLHMVAEVQTGPGDHRDDGQIRSCRYHSHRLRRCTCPQG